MKTKQEIIDLVQEEIDQSDEGIDLWEYINNCQDLSEEEIEWAHDHLGATITVTRY